MAAPPLFPTLPGLTWPVKKTPTFSTLVADHVSGREVRAALYQNPIWEFELSIEGLAADNVSYRSLGQKTFQAILNLFLACQGKYGTFLFVDPTDSYVTAQQIATGDGSTAGFVLARQFVPGGFLEPVGWTTNVGAVFINASVVSNWSLAQPNNLNFSGAPSAGAIISASFSYAFQCRFGDDVAEFSEFMQNLWEWKSLKFRSVRSF